MENIEKLRNIVKQGVTEHHGYTPEKISINITFDDTGCHHYVIGANGAFAILNTHPERRELVNPLLAKAMQGNADDFKDEIIEAIRAERAYGKEMSWAA